MPSVHERIVSVIEDDHDDDALWNCGNLAARTQAWAATTTREISNGLWVPASPTSGFNPTLSGRPQAGQVHSARWGYGGRPGHAVTASANDGGEGSPAGEQANVCVRVELAALALDLAQRRRVQQPFEPRHRQHARVEDARHADPTRRCPRTHAARSSQ